MADQNLLFVAMPVVQTVSPAIGVVAASGACSGFCPVAVSEWLEFCLPGFVKIVAVNIALCQ